MNYRTLQQDNHSIYTAQKMRFFIKALSSKFDQVHWKLRMWSHLLEKSVMENFIFFCSDADIKKSFYLIDRSKMLQILKLDDELPNLVQ